MIGILMAILALYIIGVVGLVWLVCTLMGWPFSWYMGVTVWIVINYAIGAIMKRGKKK